MPSRTIPAFAGMAFAHSARFAMVLGDGASTGGLLGLDTAAEFNGARDTATAIKFAALKRNGVLDASLGLTAINLALAGDQSARSGAHPRP